MNARKPTSPAKDIEPICPAEKHGWHDWQWYQDIDVRSLDGFLQIRHQYKCSDCGLMTSVITDTSPRAAGEAASDPVRPRRKSEVAKRLFGQ